MKKSYLLTIIFLLASLTASGEEIVVVSRLAPRETITEKTLSRIYLKRKVMWEDGKEIVPVNLSSQHPLRNSFTRKILNRGHAELVSYWNEQHFKGISPPTVVESEEAVKLMVRHLEGAIGYIRRKSLEPNLHVLFSFEVNE